MQALVGNRAAQRILADRSDRTDRTERHGGLRTHPSHSPSTLNREVQRDAKSDAEAAMLDKEKVVQKKIDAFTPQMATVTVEDPISPSHVQTDSRYKGPPAVAKLMHAGVAPRPQNENQKRSSFDDQSAAVAFASTIAYGQGAVVVNDSGYFFVVKGTINGTPFNRTNTYEVAAPAGVVAVLDTNAVVLKPGSSYKPIDGDNAATVRDVSKEEGAPPDAKSLREMLSIPDPGQKDRDPKVGGAKDKTVIKPENAEAFLRTYISSRAMEILGQNRAMADKLSEQFKPQPAGGSKVGPEAKKLIDSSREMVPKVQELTATEMKLTGALESTYWKGLGRGDYKVTLEGITRYGFEWRDDFQKTLDLVKQTKADTLSKSPVLANTARIEPTPDAIDYYWDAYKKVNPLARIGGGILSSVVHYGDPPELKESELAKGASADSDEAVRQQFLVKLDDIRKAINLTEHHVLSGDIEYLLGLSSLRQIAIADMGKVAPANAALKTKLDELLKKYEIKKIVETVGTIAVQIAGLFVPGGQFISAAIGMAQAVNSFDNALEQWSVSKAAVDPATALVDQQEAQKAMIMESINLGMSAVALAVEVEAVAKGKSLAPHDPAGTGPHDPAPGGGTGGAKDPHAPGGGGDAAGDAQQAGMVDDFMKKLKGAGRKGTPTVLDDASAVGKMAKNTDAMVAKWATEVNVVERAKMALPVVNERFAAAGIRQCGIDVIPGGVCLFNERTWMISLGADYLTGDMNALKLNNLLNLTVHEARHGEQSWSAARYFLSQNPNATAAEMSAALGGMEIGTCNWVKSAGVLDKSSAEFKFGKEMFEARFTAAGRAASNKALSEVKPVLDASGRRYAAAQALDHASKLNPANPQALAQANAEMQAANANYAAMEKAVGGPKAVEDRMKAYHALPTEADAYRVGPQMAGEIQVKLGQMMAERIAAADEAFAVAASRFEEMKIAPGGWSAEQIDAYRLGYAQDMARQAELSATSRKGLQQVAEGPQAAALKVSAPPNQRLAAASTWADANAAKADAAAARAEHVADSVAPSAPGKLPQFKQPGELASPEQVKAHFTALQEQERARAIKAAIDKAKVSFP